MVNKRKVAAENFPPENIKRGGRYYTGKGSVLEPGPTVFRECYPWVFKKTIATRLDDRKASVDTSLRYVLDGFRKANDRGGRVWWVGNGGSSAIASHMAVDYTKNGGIRSLAMSDVPTLTCLANDYGYDRVFSKHLAFQATRRDVICIISTSGRSLNIVDAARAARTLNLAMIVTLTGMNPNNVLRQLGDVNFYVPSTSYGIVETAHLILMHSLLTA